MTPGLGTRSAGQLIQKLRTPEAIFRASATELEGHGLRPKSYAQSLSSGCAFEDAADQQNKLAEFGSQIIPITDPRYPQRLREIYDPPVVLFARGRVELLDTLMIAVVGTRRPTRYGVAATEKLSSDLAMAGLTIVSGMARGIDTAAHQSALSVDGSTVAVFGCGVDLVYPAENRKLAASLAEKGLGALRISDGGAAVSPEFPDSKSYRERHEYRCPGSRRSAVQRFCHHGAPGDGSAARSICRTGQHHIEDELGA